MAGCVLYLSVGCNAGQCRGTMKSELKINNNHLKGLKNLKIMDIETYLLDKNVWTQEDYEQMGWHDSRIYGLLFLPDDETETTDLIFDIDYIFKWVHPVPPEQYFSFWLSPCTLIFKDTFALKMDIDNQGMKADLLEIADLILVSKIEQEKGVWIYEWEMELQEGNIRFKSTGFSQMVRHKPIYTKRQVLTLTERDGVSFNLTPCDL